MPYTIDHRVVTVSVASLAAPADYTVQDQDAALVIAPIVGERRSSTGRLLLHSTTAVTVTGPVELYAYRNGRYRKAADLDLGDIAAAEGREWAVAPGGAEALLVVAAAVSGTVVLSYVAEDERA